jgi:thiamine-monophosphate kinase
MQNTEDEFYAWLRSVASNRTTLRLGIGDDAAVVDIAGTDCVVTSDLLAEGVHFEADTGDFMLVGRKALAVNLSDLAAMAATPVAVTVSLLLNKRQGMRAAKNLISGMSPLAAAHEVALAGGDTNSWDGATIVSVTALGRLEGEPLTRAGARPGDAILVTGTLGGSILGKHLQFDPRVREAIALRSDFEIHAAIDISDGLALDLSRMASASQVGVEIELAHIPISAAAYELASANSNGKSALERALSDGEDFELLLAVPPADAQRICEQGVLGIDVTNIGRFTVARELYRIDEQGKRRPLEVEGYTHGL